MQIRMSIFRLVNLIITFLLGINITAQNEYCKNCYVWEFSNSEGKRTEISKMISSDFEDILSQKEGCTVLQRSNLPFLYEQIQNEEVFSSLPKINASTRKELQGIRAQNVIFGEVNLDFQGNISLRVSFENIETTSIKSDQVFLIGEDAYNFTKRRRALSIFIDAFLGIESKQKEIISGFDSTESANISNYRTQLLGSWKVVLNTCESKENVLTCFFTITSKYNDRKFKIYGGSTRIFDYLGSQFHANNKNNRIGNSSPRTDPYKKLKANLPTDFSVFFENFPSDLAKIALLKIRVGASGLENYLIFQDVDIVRLP